MHRHFASAAVVLSFVTAFPARAPLGQERQDSNLVLQHTHHGGSVYQMTATGSRGSQSLVFSSGPDGILLVDTFTVERAKLLRGALDKVSSASVKFVVNTHWHDDHTGGNPLFGEQAVILARPSVKQKMMKEMHPPWLAKPVPAFPAHAWPEITLDEPITVHFNGEEVRLIPFPRSHTDGDTVVYFAGSKVLCMGDTIFIVGGMLGPSSDDWSGGDLQSLAKNLGELLPQVAEDAKVVPGHGPVIAIADLRAYHKIMTTALDTVRSKLAAGKTLSVILAEGLPAGLPTSTIWRIDPGAWIESAHESLTRKR